MNYKKSLFSFFTIALTIFAQTSYAQTMLSPGSPDPTFGVNGRALTQIEDGFGANDTILLPDGKIISLSTHMQIVGNINRYYFRLARHNPNGSPDNGFGVNGIKEIQAGEGASGTFHGEKLYLQPDGKIIIAGTFNDDLGMLRVNADGSLDKSFGARGQIRTDFSEFEENSRDYFRGLTVRPDGKIIVYGKSIVENPIYSCNPNCYPPEFERVAIAQYNADGSPDLSFGAGGMQRSRFTNNAHHPQTLVVEPDGKFFFIVGVYERAIVNGDWANLFTQIAVHYNADGTIDAGYGKEGTQVLPNAAFYPQPDGKFLALELCYSSQSCNGSNARITRFNSDFTVDTTFGSNGTASHYLANVDYGDLHLQPDGKFIFTSFISNGFTGVSSTIYLYRFNADGNMDFSFGSGGAIAFDLDESNELVSYIPKILTQPDGKILAAGAFYPPQNVSGIRGIVMKRFIGRNGKRGF